MKFTKPQKFVLGIVLILALGGFLMSVTEKPEGTSPGPIAEPSDNDTSHALPPDEETEAKLKIGTGGSIKTDEKEAVKEAYDEMMAGLENEKPQFVILLSEEGYDQKKILSEANRLLGDGVKIFGYMSLIGVMVNDGFEVGEKGAVGLMGFSSEDMVFGVGACDLNETDSPREAGKIAISRAIKDAGKVGEDEAKMVILSTSTFGMGVEEEVMAGLEDVLGVGEVPITGGVSSGKPDYTGGWEIFVNNRTYTKGIATTIIYTDLKIGYVFLCGFNPTETTGIVTKVRDGGRTIVEIDNMPAAEVFNEWLGGILSHNLGTGNWFVDVTGMHPLGEKVIESGGIPNYRLVYAWHFNPDNSLTAGSNVAVGTQLHLLEGNQDMLIQRPGLAARLARSRGMITESEIAGVMMEHCAGTMLSIPEGDMYQVAPIINQATGDAPFLGEFSSGEFGYFSGGGNRYGNMMASMIIFGKN